MYDIIIIGAGPAGLTSAIYARRSNKSVLVLEANQYGGQIVTTDQIDNYPSTPHISGYDFATNLYNQVIELGADVKFEKAIEINSNKDEKEVVTNKNSYKAKSVIIAIGVRNRKLDIPGEEKFEGKGVSYCATCDGMFYKNKTVAVYGGGNSAIDGALYLSNICEKVYLIYRQKDFKLNNDNTNKLKNLENVEIIFSTNIIDLIGTDKLDEITLKDDSSEYNLKVDGLFIEIGYVPVSEMCKNIIDIDDRGYIIAKEDCYTNQEGIFVAGDIRIKDIRQLTTACSDGTVAAIAACKYINK